MAGRSWSGVSHPFMRPAGRPGVSPILDGALLIGEYPTPDDVAHYYAKFTEARERHYMKRYGHKLNEAGKQAVREDYEHCAVTG